jgi:hypothetical protein
MNKLPFDLQAMIWLTILPIVAVYAAIIAWPAARICRRAGFTPWLGLLSVVPLVNLLLLWYVAYADWPSESRIAPAR